MIKLEKIYEATDGGKKILSHYCVQCCASLNDPKKPFCYRAESEPSAYVLPPYSPHNPNNYWKIKDFGRSGLSLSPIDVVMESKDLTFYEAIVHLATRFNVRDEKDKTVCKPRIERRPANEKELKHDLSLEWVRFSDSIPENTLHLWTSHVEASNLEDLGWHLAEFTRYVNDKGELVTRYSTGHYPIFVRECRTNGGPTFFKVYEPLNLDKGRRFAVIGARPQNYINGLYELEEAFKKRNKRKTDDDEDEKETKLERAIICSGERDAVCCYSRGEHPIWFNSETDIITGAKISSIMKFVKQLYNIPDIDATGRAQGRKLALKFISIKTVWLPESLRKYNDDRGNRRKDLRDWMEIYPDRSDFQHILNRAVEARFWDENPSARARNKYVINSVRLNYFLSLNEYYCLDEDVEEPRIIHIDGNVIEQVYSRDIRRFVYQWAHDSKQNISMDVLETIQTTMRMKGNTLECMHKFKPEFNTYTSDSQMFVFRNGTLKVTGSEMTFYPHGTPLDVYVWKTSVIDHDFCMFNTEAFLGADYPDIKEVSKLRSKGRDVQPLRFFSFTDMSNLQEMRIKVLQPNISPMFSYIINSSRLYWRKEMETRFEGDLTAMQEYQESHKFCIEGEGLSDAEIAEQMQNLANKIFTIGYLLHEFKAPTRAWAVMAMDNVVDSRGRCNGRSGKSFFGKALANLCKTQELRGRDKRLLDNPHFLEEVTEETRIIHVEDCGRNFQVGPFFSLITSDMQVNVKMVRSMTLPFSKSPKFLFSTNYVPNEEDSSTTARILPVVFSDYYHMKGKGSNYLQEREISDDFGRQLMYDNYPEELWQADFMFMMQCLQFYLSVADSNKKIMPPMETIEKRANAQNMDPKFRAWAERYFFVEEGHLNTEIPRAVMYDAYLRFTANSEPLDKARFKKSLRDFCTVHEYIEDFNPREVCTDKERGRIMRNNIEYFFLVTSTLYNELEESSDVDVNPR